MSVEPFAWASIAAPACCKTCALARREVSAAKSASAILDRAPVVNSVTFIRLDTVYSNLFCSVPKLPLMDEALAIAPSSTARELDAVILVKTSAELIFTSGEAVTPFAK